MLERISELIYIPNIDECDICENQLSTYINDVTTQAFVNNESTSLLAIHRILYSLNLAHLAASWESPANNISHPILTTIKFQLENHWKISETQKYSAILQNIPPVENFPNWIQYYVAKQFTDESHPLFKFLQETATLEQMREFFLQETPLEMLFGDIVAFMLPGVYGSIKTEFLKNYWDEVGRAQEAKVHRNLRARLMKQLNINENVYKHNIELFICEELGLINLYLSAATNRSQHTELIGIMLATELMIPNRFQYLLAGWQRLGFNDDLLQYYIEHISVDAEHSYAWLNHIVLPIINKYPHAMPDIIRGVLRRIDATTKVLNRLYTIFCNG